MAFLLVSSESKVPQEFKDETVDGVTIRFAWGPKAKKL